MSILSRVIIILSIIIILFIYIFLSKYDIWALSEGMCIYNANSVFVALLLSYILLAINLINFYLQKIKYSLFFIIISILMIAYWDPLIYDKLKIDNAPCQDHKYNDTT